MLRLDTNNLVSESGTADDVAADTAASRRSRAEEDAEERRPMLLAAAEEDDTNTSGDSSRSTTASHSRNTSSGSNDTFGDGHNSGVALASSAPLVQDAEQIQLLADGDRRKSKLSTYSD